MPLHPQKKLQKNNMATQKKNATKTSITQRLRNDFGRSVGVTTDMLKKKQKKKHQAFRFYNDSGLT